MLLVAQPSSHSAAAAMHAQSHAHAQSAAAAAGGVARAAVPSREQFAPLPAANLAAGAFSSSLPPTHPPASASATPGAAASASAPPLHLDFPSIQTEVEKRLVSLSYDFSKYIDGMDRGRAQAPQTLRAKEAIKHSMRAVDEILRSMMRALKAYAANPRAYASTPGWSQEDREQYAAYVQEMKGMLEHYAQVLQPRPLPTPQQQQGQQLQQQKRAIPSIAHTLFPAAGTVAGAVGAGSAAAPTLTRNNSPPNSILDGSAAAAVATRAQFRKRSENVEYVSSAHSLSAPPSLAHHERASALAHHEPRSEAARACKASMAAAAAAWNGDPSMVHAAAATAAAARSASASPTPSPSTSLSHTRRRVLEANLRKQLALVAPPVRAPKSAANAAADAPAADSSAAVAAAAELRAESLDQLERLHDAPEWDGGCIGLHPRQSKLERAWIQTRRAMVRGLEKLCCCAPNTQAAQAQAQREAEAVRADHV